MNVLDNKVSTSVSICLCVCVCSERDDIWLANLVSRSLMTSVA